MRKSREFPEDEHDEAEYEPAFVEGDDIDEDVLAEEDAITAAEEEAAMACPRCGAQPEDCVCGKAHD